MQRKPCHIPLTYCQEHQQIFPKSDETQKDYMKQEKQEIRSTTVLDEDAMLNFTLTPGVCHKDVYL